MIYEQQSGGTLEDVVRRLTTAAAEHRFGVLSQLDLRGKLHEKGVEFGHACWVLEVCSPVQAKKVLEADIRLATLLPCRIAIYEKDGQLMVGTLRPSGMVQMLGAEGVAQVAADVEDALIAIIDDACTGA
jgi:uncharacterized protein (DUF302 family)